MTDEPHAETEHLDETTPVGETTPLGEATPLGEGTTLEPASDPELAEATVAARPRHRKGRSRRSRRLRQGVEWLAVAAVALLVAVLLRAFVVQTFYVPSGSMLPTLQVGDRIIVDKLYGPIHRFDIVVFRRTPGDTTTSDADLVKRVIGLPGERISSAGSTIYINGQPIDEAWLPTTSGPDPGEQLCPQSNFNIHSQTIPRGDYFVMGDCRGNSEDSRAWGYVPASYIVGKVFVVVWRHGHPWWHWF